MSDQLSLCQPIINIQCQLRCARDARVAPEGTVPLHDGIQPSPKAPWHFSIASDSISLNNLALESCLRNGNPSDVSLVHFTDWHGGEECTLSGERGERNDGKCNDVFSVRSCSYREFRCAGATSVRERRRVNWDAELFTPPEADLLGGCFNVACPPVIRSYR
jgi:hypothetical protein